VIGERTAFILFTILCDLAAVFGIYAIGRAIGGFWTARLAALALISYPFLPMDVEAAELRNTVHSLRDLGLLWIRPLIQ